MKAFITGNRGFVGRHMTRELLDRGWDVDGCDTARNHGIVMPEDDAHWHFRHNTHLYDLVVHCAAAEPHRAAIDSKPMLLAANLRLDSAMFEWAARTRQRRVLYLSSSAAYPVRMQTGRQHHDGAGRPVRGDTPLREDDIRLHGTEQPDAHYGWTKLTGERMAAAANEAGVPTHVVRPFSGYGEDQSLNFPFPAIVDRARRGDLTVWGPPGQTRDWIHISDVINGALAVVDAGDLRPVNLCTGIGTEMGDLAREVALAAGAASDFRVSYLEDRPTGVLYRVGDPTRFNEHYTAKISIEEGVRRALAG